MFGLAWLLGKAIIGAYGDFKDAAEDSEKRKIAKDNNEFVYYDVDGKKRLVSNNVWVSTEREKRTGHIVERGVLDGKVYKDYTIIWERDAETQHKKIAIANGYKAYLIGDSGNKNTYHENDDIKGCRYKDVNNGNIYLCKTFNGADFFIDINTLEIISISDAEKDILNEIYTSEKNRDRKKQEL